MGKKLRVFILILIYVVTTPFLNIGRGGRMRAIRNGQLFCQKLARILGISVELRGTIQSHGMIVANHLSYVDIISMLATFPCRFITFTELAQTPGVGLVATLGQTIFVNRSRPSQVKHDIAYFEHELKDGRVPIVLFPEGSSFDGSRLMPFKSSLFESAIRTGAHVQPICVRYLELDGEPVTVKNRDRVFYYGEMELLPQLMNLFRLRSLKVEIVACQPISPVGKTRKELAELAHQAISSHFICVNEA